MLSLGLYFVLVEKRSSGSARCSWEEAGIKKRKGSSVVSSLTWSCGKSRRRELERRDLQKETRRSRLSLPSRGITSSEKKEGLFVLPPLSLRDRRKGSRKKKEKGDRATPARREKKEEGISDTSCTRTDLGGAAIVPPQK